MCICRHHFVVGLFCIFVHWTTLNQPSSNLLCTPAGETSWSNNFQTFKGFVMKFKRLHLLPGSLFLLVMVTFFSTYGIAVWMDHVEPGFPYISDTGTLPPESCIFAQFINIAAFLLLACVYVRYLQLGEVLQRPAARPRFPRWLNAAAAGFGAASCLGLDLVANFQETSVLVVHMVGAFLCFISGTVYFILQTYMSRMLMAEVASVYMFASRVVISALCILLTASTIACGTLSIKQFDGKDIKKWTSEHSGWDLHLVSTVSEWLLVVCFCGFIVSFSPEFKGLEIEGPVLRVTLPLPTEVEKTHPET